MINLLFGLLVLGFGFGLWYIGETWKYGEEIVVAFFVLALAYCVGGIIRWAL